MPQGSCVIEGYSCSWAPKVEAPRAATPEELEDFAGELLALTEHPHESQAQIAALQLAQHIISCGLCIVHPDRLTPEPHQDPENDEKSRSVAISPNKETVRVDYVSIEHETEAAWLVAIGLAEFWMPKSQVQIDPHERVVKMPAWLAVEKNLV